MTVRRWVALAAVPTALAAICGLLLLRPGVRLESSLDGLIGLSGRTIPPVIRLRSSGLVPVLVSSKDPAKARAAADGLFMAFHQVRSEGYTVASRCFHIRYRSADDEAMRLMEFCRRRRAGFASATASEKLKTPEGRAAVARTALRRWYASPVPPLFSAEEDPFCLLDGFVTSLPTSFSGWFPKNGVLTAERNGVTHLLMLLELKDYVPHEMDKLLQFRRLLAAAVEAVKAAPDVSIAACGALLHTAVSAGRCQREIGWLTWLSLAFIALLAVAAFRSVRWIPLLALSLAAAVLAGFGAVLAVFGGLHLMTVVIGTTVLGLVIDYSFHWLLQDGDERRSTVRNLAISFVTTEVSLVPLMLSSIAVLRQAALFLGVGLAAALGLVLWGYPQVTADVRPQRTEGGFGWARWVSAAIGLTTLAGLVFVRFGTEMTAVYRPPAELLAAEKLFAELNGTASETGFVVTEGEELEEMLGRESSLALPAAVPRLSRFLPPLSFRRRVAEDVARLYAEQGEKLAKALGLGKLVPPPAPTAWRESDDLPPQTCEAFLSRAMPAKRAHSLLSLTIAAAPRPAGALPAGVVFCQPKETIAAVLSDWAGEALKLLGVSLVLMLGVLAVCCRRRALAVFAPSLFALVVVAGLLGLCGVKINLFHLLAGFLLAGMSVDYTVFLHSGKALKPAFCSLLTSFFGFGALTFVSFPVVQAFGAVLGVGLPAAFVAALATMPRAPSVEKAASPLGLEILFVCYRLLGLRVLHVGAAAVGLCVWTFSPAIRRASPSVRKVVNFTRSLADKLVVMAEGKDLPCVRTDGSADAAAFLADVRAGKGVFVLSSHCGTVETLVALGACDAVFHAWMDVGRTSVFNRFYLRHARRKRVVIHPISEIGMETAFFAGDALERGDSLVMAGDRGRGAFRFAHALGAPVYFVACVADGPTSYRAIIRRLPDETAAMEKAYSAALGEVTAAWPDQWYEWNDSTKEEKT